MQKHEIIILIPCFNEESTISKICNEANKFAQVLVLDDASTDNSKKVLKKNKINFISNVENQGYEKNLIKGFKHVFNNLKEKKYIITLDGDGELKTNNISKLIDFMRNEKMDLVIGKREKFNRFSENLLNLIFFVKYGIYDPVSGLKLYKIEYLNKIIEKLSNKMFLVDAVCLFKKEKFKVSNIHIEVKKRKDKSRVGNNFTSNLKMLRIILRSILY